MSLSDEFWGDLTGYQQMLASLESKQVVRAWVQVGDLRIYFRSLPRWNRKGLSTYRCLTIADVQTVRPGVKPEDFEKLVVCLERDLEPHKVVLYFETISGPLRLWLTSRGFKHDDEAPECMYRLPPERIPVSFPELQEVLSHA